MEVGESAPSISRSWQPNAEMMKSHLSCTSCSSSTCHSPFSSCTLRANSIAQMRPALFTWIWRERIRHLTSINIQLQGRNYQREEQRSPVWAPWTAGTRTSPRAPTPSAPFKKSVFSVCLFSVHGCMWTKVHVEGEWGRGQRAHTSSGTGLMPVKPLRNTTVTRCAPVRRALVAQSNAVSPAPSTTTWPQRRTVSARHAHTPAHNVHLSKLCYCTFTRSLNLHSLELSSHYVDEVMNLWYTRTIRVFMHALEASYEYNRHDVWVTTHTSCCRTLYSNNRANNRAINHQSIIVITRQLIYRYVAISCRRVPNIKLVSDMSENSNRFEGHAHRPLLSLSARRIVLYCFYNPRIPDRRTGDMSERSDSGLELATDVVCLCPATSGASGTHWRSGLDHDCPRRRSTQSSR